MFSAWRIVVFSETEFYATMSSFVRMRKNWCYPLIRFLSKSILCAENQSHFFWIARILARNCLNSGSYLIPQCISWGILSIGRSSRFLREGCGGNTFPFIRFPPSVLIIYSYWMEENAETKRETHPKLTESIRVETFLRKIIISIRSHLMLIPPLALLVLLLSAA